MPTKSKKPQSKKRKITKNQKDETEKEYTYTLVLFSKEKSEGKLIFDCVPTKWLSFEKGQLLTKFLEPSVNGKYSDDDLDLLGSFVKEKLDPPESWPKYKVKIVGRAGKLTKKY